MTKRQKLALPLELLLCLILLPFATALAQEAEDDTTLIGVAEETPSLSTLVNAIDAAGLTKTLQGSGPYTLFAPTNDAFAKLSSGELSALLSDRDALRRVLSYHIVPGSFTTSDITSDMSAQGFTTLEGQTLPITQAGVGNASVTTVNLPAANGVLFAIDTVLTPPETVADAPPAADATSSASGEEGDGALYSSSAEARERFELLDVDSSGVMGSVLVAEYAGERAVVTVSLSGTSTGSEYVLALYSGSCDALSGVISNLEPYSSALGFSTTVVDLPYAGIVAGDHALTVTLSASDSGVVACGEVGR